MEYSDRSITANVVLFLFAVVASQLLYMGLSGADIGFDSGTLWTLEALAFLAITVFGLAGLVRFGGNPMWAAIAVGGLLNVIQAGMGIAMFGPLKAADEVLAPALEAVQGGAFFFYFAGKLAFGFAAIILGLGMFRDGENTSGKKTLGIICSIAGLGAIAFNIAAIGSGMSLVLWAGASGTLATFLLALTLLIRARGAKA